jgi:hypothetical protein
MSPMLSQTPSEAVPWLHNLATRNRVLCGVAAEHLLLSLLMLDVVRDARPRSGARCGLTRLARGCF